MYAVFEVAGNQYRAEVGDKVQVEHLSQEVGAKVEFDKVLMVADGDQVQVGQPTVDGAKVVASVTEQSKGPRTLIFQYRIGGKRHRTQATHRQNYTWLQVEQIVRRLFLSEDIIPAEAITSNVYHCNLCVSDFSFSEVADHLKETHSYTDELLKTVQKQMTTRLDDGDFYQWNCPVFDGDKEIGVQIVLSKR